MRKLATLTVQQSNFDGVALNFVAADVAGDEFDNSSGRVLVVFRNDDTSSHTATIASPGACSQGFNHPVDITIGADGEEQLAGFFFKGRFNDADDLVQITYDDVTSVFVAVVQLS